MIKNFQIAKLIILMVVLCSCEAEQQVTYEPNWKSLETEVPEWFQDAKFGIYAHWGPVSSVFEGAQAGRSYHGWHGMKMYENKGSRSWRTGEVAVNGNGKPKVNPTTNYLHHVEKYGDPAEFGYKYIIEQFKPSAFDAKEWAKLFAASGAKFAGPVAMHHDNFAMWDSKTTRWNSMNYGGIDVAAELKREIEAHGMKYMGSFHHAFTWKYFAPAHEYGGIKEEDYDLYTDPHLLASNELTERFYDEWWAKLKEFIDVYQPDLLWFDWWLENMDEDIRQEFLAYYYNKGIEWGKDVAVCFKESTFPEETAIRDYERGRPNQPKDRPWLTDTSPGAWFYRPHTNFKDANSLIDILVDIVSKNGCMLLNVPPDPNGKIPEEMENLLTNMGSWLELNGEAIYKTRPWIIFGEGPTRLPAGGHKIEEKGEIHYTNKDIRFTQGDENTVYAIVLDVPESKLEIRTMGSYLGVLNGEIEKIELLGSQESISWERTADALLIENPEEFPTAYAHVYKISLEDYMETDIGGE